MNKIAVLCCLVAAIVFTGCARLEFSTAPKSPGKAAEVGLEYYEAIPYLMVTYGKDCSVSAKVLMVPGEKRTAQFHTGYGSADLKVELKDGMIVSVGQITDTKIPETVTAATGLVGALTEKGILSIPPATGCDSRVELYRVTAGDIAQEPSKPPFRASPAGKASK